MENATTRISPHMLAFGREPLSPLDSWCKHLRDGETNTHGEYLATLKPNRAELEEIAEENIKTNLQRERERYNASKTTSDINEGDRVMLRRNKMEYSLSPKFDGPFDVLWRKGPNVKLRLPRRDKWVHLDHVKRYSGSAPSVIKATHGQMLTSPEVLTPATNRPEENMESADWAQQTLGA